MWCNEGCNCNWWVDITVNNYSLNNDVKYKTKCKGSPRRSPANYVPTNIFRLSFAPYLLWDKGHGQRGQARSQAQHRPVHKTAGPSLSGPAPAHACSASGPGPRAKHSRSWDR
jgi:hypothetical protein